MRKIDVRSYDFMGQPYNVKESLVAVLMHPELKLGAVEVLKRNRLGEKILDATDMVTFEEEDYKRLKTALETLTGFGRADVELLQRVLEAPEETV